MLSESIGDGRMRNPFLKSENCVMANNGATSGDDYRETVPRKKNAPGALKT
jgi:hypothetical protein